MPDAELVEQDADRWQGVFWVVALVVSMMLADLVEFGGIGGAGGVGGFGGGSYVGGTRCRYGVALGHGLQSRVMCNWTCCLARSWVAQPHTCVLASLCRGLNTTRFAAAAI